MYGGLFLKPIEPIRTIRTHNELSVTKDDESARGVSLNDVLTIPLCTFGVPWATITLRWLANPFTKAAIMYEKKKKMMI